MILIIINCFLLIIGCFMDSTVAILILGPVFMPVLTASGIDPVHFGVLMVLNPMIGLMTPPFGRVLFVMQQVSGLSFEQVVKACMPTLVTLFVVLFLITFFPPLVNWLPTLMM
jgi:TRAP-type C4-dicarboxylate transport system permease large subunit